MHRFVDVRVVEARDDHADRRHHSVVCHTFAGAVGPDQTRAASKHLGGREFVTPKAPRPKPLDLRHVTYGMALSKHSLTRHALVVGACESATSRSEARIDRPRATF
jgi:hypothetical protein